MMARSNRPPVSLSKINTLLGENKDEKLIVVIVGTVVDDERLQVAPKTSVVALRFSQNARNRIIAAGGRALTFDQLALERPTGANTLLIQGKRHAREATKHFRGLHGKHAKPYVRGGAKTGRKGENTKTRQKM